MPFSRITTNFTLENEHEFIESFQRAMIEVLKIPEKDRQIILDQKTEGFYQPPNCSGKYMIIEIKMFAGRTLETKKTLYKRLFLLANSIGIENTHMNVVLEDVEKENWGLRGGVPASEVDLGFNTNI